MYCCLPLWPQKIEGELVAMSSVSAFLREIGAAISGYIEKIGQLPALWREDQQTFFLVAGILFAVVLLLVVLVVLAARSGRKKRSAKQQTLANSSNLRFVPVEDSDAELDAIFLPLDERIVAAQQGLNADIWTRIKKKSPQSLADIVSAYPRCTPVLKEQLTNLVHSEKMMEAYSRHLGEKGYSQGVLVDAWAYFPNDEVLKSFVDLLASKNERVQMSAVRLLSAMHEIKILPLLVLALVRPDRYVPARVAEVFVSMPAQSASLLSHMLPEIEDKHKEIVLEIIAQTKTAYDPTNVIACLRHKNYQIRVAAALALGAGCITAAIPNLMLAAGDKRWQVRAAAAKALGMVGDSRALTVLEALTHDEEGWVASSAKEALAQFANVKN